MIKDGDSNSLSILQADFPSIRNVLDKNHYIKTIPQHVMAAVKANKAPALKGRHLQIQQQINRILGIVHRYEDHDLMWRKQLFAHLGQQMVAHICGNHTACPPSTSAAHDTTNLSQQASTSSRAMISLEEFSGYTMFKTEMIGLSWYCHVDADQTGISRSLLPAGQPKSQKWKYKVVNCQATKHWLTSYVNQQAERDEIMCYGSSNRNESINSKFAVKASKMNDFRYCC